MRRRAGTAVAVVVALGVVATAAVAADRIAASSSVMNTQGTIGALPPPRGTSHDGTLGPGNHAITIKVGDRHRSFILYIPPNPPVAHRPLVLVFHGADSTAAQTERDTDFEPVAARDGEVLAFLQGYGDTWNESAGHTPAARAHVNDVAFTAAVIAAVGRLVDFDHAHVVAAGVSNGALMVEDLGCKLSGSLALIVPVEGELPVSVARSCAPARPISVLEVHGTADTAIPYGGGPFAGVGGGTTVLSAPGSVARWAALDRCARTPRVTRPAPSIRLTTYTRCAKHATVTLRTIVGGGHVWGASIAVVVDAAIRSLPDGS